VTLIEAVAGMLLILGSIAVFAGLWLAEVSERPAPARSEPPIAEIDLNRAA
jgi:hypothetical protein